MAKKCQKRLCKKSLLWRASSSIEKAIGMINDNNKKVLINLLHCKLAYPKKKIYKNLLILF